MEQELGSLWGSNLSFIQKLFRVPLRLIPAKTRLRVRSGANKGFLWIVGSNVHKCWLGTYEHEKQNEIIRVVKEGMTVWDIGANVGFYTLAFSRAVGDAGHVVAFEPLGSNVSYVLKHITINGVRNVKVVQAAVSDNQGFVSFSIGVHSSMGKIETSSAYKIPSVSIDGYLGSESCRRPDLLKIDVEGAEAYVLRGASRLLQDSGPQIWLALHGSAAMKECSDILKSFGYNFYTVKGTLIKEITVDEIVAIRDREIAQNMSH